MAFSARASRARAQLTLKEPPASVGAKPGGTIARLDLQFNPSTLQLGKTTEWRRSPSRMAGQSALPEFVGSGPRTLSLEVFLDATATHDDSVEQAVEKLMKACVPTPASLGRKKPASPWVRFEWGSARTTSFDGVLSNLSVSYTLFDVDGTPLRATCSLSIEEASVEPPGQNPTSGARTARSTHTLVAGDSLAMLAWREYGDATAWRVVAEANGIDDPMALAPGTELVVPALRDDDQVRLTGDGHAYDDGLPDHGRDNHPDNGPAGGRSSGRSSGNGFGNGSGFGSGSSEGER